uniref:RING-type domain-containing protein n=1 Tax=Chromera velia CCMP2878 TaxID=1169474 RepID=A0A0G4FBV5_9ALVE|eukprot:Cvel_16257.t1-p1 / transcript=Cvel_16257.t1 / gene=Cvel_16257 / organism=Chromera_velia_CCMP2878 / gene_product=Probable E3 ubiquitin-protein ligase RNF217, putative / transcript_product=Probable E3 ubiquitin-protein ligase RNF217, putative / location=Cvel_scaffold1244:21477-25394(-) / protein_length=944 / sequence_SO=supercontig / SO=protein_coding / is_pseudo=false
MFDSRREDLILEATAHRRVERLEEFLRNAPVPPRDSGTVEGESGSLAETERVGETGRWNASVGVQVEGEGVAVQTETETQTELVGGGGKETSACSTEGGNAVATQTETQAVGGEEARRTSAGAPLTLYEIMGLTELESSVSVGAQSVPRRRGDANIPHTETNEHGVQTGAEDESSASASASSPLPETTEGELEADLITKREKETSSPLPETTEGELEADLITKREKEKKQFEECLANRCPGSLTSVKSKKGPNKGKETENQQTEKEAPVPSQTAAGSSSFAASTFCRKCLLEFVEAQVEQARFFVPTLKCICGLGNLTWASCDRAIQGGTGRFARRRGTVTRRLLGVAARALTFRCECDATVSLFDREYPEGTPYELEDAAQRLRRETEDEDEYSDEECMAIEDEEGRSPSSSPSSRASVSVGFVKSLWEFIEEEGEGKRKGTEGEGENETETPNDVAEEGSAFASRSSSVRRSCSLPDVPRCPAVCASPVEFLLPPLGIARSLVTPNCKRETEETQGEDEWCDPLPPVPSERDPGMSLSPPNRRRFSTSELPRMGVNRGESDPGRNVTSRGVSASPVPRGPSPAPSSFESARSGSVSISVSVSAVSSASRRPRPGSKEEDSLVSTASVSEGCSSSSLTAAGPREGESKLGQEGSEVVSPPPETVSAAQTELEQKSSQEETGGERKVEEGEAVVKEKEPSARTDRDEDIREGEEPGSPLKLDVHLDSFSNFSSAVERLRNQYVSRFVSSLRAVEEEEARLLMDRAEEVWKKGWSDFKEYCQLRLTAKELVFNWLLQSEKEEGKGKDGSGEGLEGMFSAGGTEGRKALEAEFQHLAGAVVDPERKTAFLLRVVNELSTFETRCCGTFFCWKCQTSHSDDFGCEDFENDSEYLSRFDNERDAEPVRCPNCRVPVLRSEGCNSMQCICGTQFCYACASDQNDAECSC